MLRTLRFAIALLATAALSLGATPASQKPAKKKKYRSSVGKPAAAKPNAKATVPLRAVKKVTRRVIPKGPPVSPRTRAEAHDGVFQKVAHGADIPVENAAALIPFFEH